MHYHKWAVCLSTLLCSGLSLHTALAADQLISSDHPDSFVHTLLNNALTSAVVSISAGPAWENEGDSQTLSLQPEVEKYYTSSNQHHSLMNSQLFLAVQQALSLPVMRNTNATGQFGLNFVTTGNAKPSGNIWDDADPTFNNYTYHYQIQHKEVSAKARLLVDSGYMSIKPFVSASVGVGFNRAYHFNNIPLISEAVASTNYSSPTTTAITWGWCAKRFNTTLAWRCEL